MKAENFLAQKFLLSVRRKHGFSALAWIAWLGIMLSVAAFVLVDAVARGAGMDLQEKILGFSSHVTLVMQSESLVESSAKILGNAVSADLQKVLLQDPDLLSARAYLEAEVFLNPWHEMKQQAVRVQAIAGPWTDAHLQVRFREGKSWQDLAAPAQGLPGILIAGRLADELSLRSGVEGQLEWVELIYPLGEVGPAGDLEPSLRRFEVIGNFSTGYYNFDENHVLIAYSEGKKLLGAQAAARWGIFLKNPDQAPEFKQRFAGLPGVDFIKTWQEQNGKLFGFLRLERAGMMAVLALMLLLASLNLISLLTLLAYERRREMALLRALGLTAAKVAGIFYRIGAFLGFLGLSVGLVVGLGLVQLLSWIKISVPEAYYLESLPVRLDSFVCLGVGLGAFVLSILAAYLPAREGRAVSIVAAMRQE